MFWLSDRRRRGVCRAGFWTLCVLPTLATLAWGGWVRLPVARTLAERDLARRWGVEVEVAQVSQPRPGVTRYGGVRLVDAASGEELARCRSLEWSGGAEGNLAVADSLVVQGAQLGSLADAARRWPRAAGGGGPVRLLAAAVLVERGETSYRAWNLDLGLKGDAQGDALRARFVWERPQGGASQLRASWQRGGRAADFSLAVETGEIPWPAWLLTAGPSAEARWVESARARGRLWIARAGGEWTIEGSGEVSQLELGQLAAGYVTHGVSGTATLRIDRARVERGRLSTAAGRLTAADGRVSPTLLEAFRRYLHAPAAVGAGTGGELVPYRRLGVEFELSGEGVVLRGVADEGARRALLEDEEGVLLAEPNRGIEPVENLVRALAGEGEAVLPATAEAQRLARRLPWSSADRGATTAKRRGARGGVQ
jgi:hypothetical protein